MKANRIKPVSKMRRYEYLRENEVVITDRFGITRGPMSGQELDDYVDEQVWREAHPGQDPNVDFGEQ